MRLLATNALAATIGLLAGAFASPTTPIDRYFGPTVDAWDLADMCSIDSDPIACLIMLGDPVMTDPCVRMREEPTDGNIMACYGITEAELFDPVLNGGE